MLLLRNRYQTQDLLTQILSYQKQSTDRDPVIQERGHHVQYFGIINHKPGIYLTYYHEQTHQVNNSLSQNHFESHEPYDPISITIDRFEFWGRRLRVSLVIYSSENPLEGEFVISSIYYLGCFCLHCKQHKFKQRFLISRINIIDKIG